MEIPTLVPAFRQLVRILEECVETSSPLYCLAKELKETDVALGDLFARFEEGATLQDLSLEEDDSVADAYERFHRLREDLEALRAAMTEDDREAARASTERTAEDLRGLEAAFDRLASLERQRPRLSPVPAVDALLRVGRAVAEERLGFEALAGRLEPMLAACEKASEGLARLGSPALLEPHAAALADLRGAVLAEDRETLPAALEAVRATAEAIPAEAPESFACPFCGGASHEGPCEETPDLPDYVQRLFEAADRLRAEEGAWPAFTAAVAEVRRRAEASLALLERVTPPAPDTPEDERQTWHAAQAAVEDGLEGFFEALGHLEALAERPEEWVLDAGLERVLAAVEDTRRVAVAWQELADSRG